MKPTPTIRILALGAIQLLILSFTGVSFGQQYVQSAIAFAGDPAPGTAGGTYGNPTLGRHSINASGDVVFDASISGGTGGRGIFVDSSGIDRAVVLTGDIAPDSGGKTFTNPDSPSLNSQGDVVFRSSLSGGTGMSGLFVESAGAISNIVMRFEPAPGTGGATYNSFNCPSINDSGDVAFQSNLSGGVPASGHGLFVRSGMVDRVVALAGDPVPGTAFSYFSVGCPFLSNNGDVAFFAVYFDGGGARIGVFLDSAGIDRIVALLGEVAPSTGGGTYEVVGNNPDIDSAGNVVFQSVVNGGTVGASFGLFKDSAGIDTSIALQGGPAPTAIGGTFTNLDIPGMAPNGDVVFPAGVSGGIATSGLFVSRDGTLQTAAKRGDFAPGTGGGTYVDVGGNNVSINNSAAVAFIATVNGGSVGLGIFRASPAPPVPSLSAPGLVYVLFALGAVGTLAASRTRRISRRANETRT